MFHKRWIIGLTLIALVCAMALPALADEKKLKLDKRLLLLPYGGRNAGGEEADRRGDAKKIGWAKLIVDGKVERMFKIALAADDKEPVFWCYLDVTPWVGKDAIFRYEKEGYLSRVTVSATYPGRENLYKEEKTPALPLHDAARLDKRSQWTGLL